MISNKTKKKAQIWLGKQIKISQIPYNGIVVFVLARQNNPYDNTHKNRSSNYVK